MHSVHPALAAPAALVDNRMEYQHLYSIYIPIAVGVFAVIVVAMVTVVLVYRRRPPERAARRHENNLVEGGYVALLVAVVAFLLYLTYTAEHKVDTVSAQERPALTVDVVGAKWEWTFSYPAYGITQRSGTVGFQPLVLPVGEAIRFNLSSDDVIHSFWVPEVRFKHQAIPGSTQVFTLMFDRPGVFPGQCAEFCGLRHAAMVFAVHAVSPAAFEAWARSGGRGPTP